MRTHQPLWAAAALALTTLASQAQELRVGLIHIDPAINSGGIQAKNALGSLLARPGFDATVGKADTVLITYEHDITPHFGMELVLGIPPKHDIIGAGTLKPGEKIGSLKQFSPTLLFNYHFADPKATWQPTVGIGPLYNTIRNIEIDPTVQPQTTASADKKWGVAMHAAMTYAFDSHWRLIGALGYTRVKNSITLSTDTSKPPYSQLGVPPGTAVTGLDVTTKNTTLSLSVGYKF